MNASFLNDITAHKSRWDSLPLAEHNALILGYTILINHHSSEKVSRAYMRKRLADCIDNFIFCCDEESPAKAGIFAKRYK